MILMRNYALPRVQDKILFLAYGLSYVCLKHCFFIEHGLGRFTNFIYPLLSFIYFIPDHHASIVSRTFHCRRNYNRLSAISCII